MAIWDLTNLEIGNAPQTARTIAVNDIIRSNINSEFDIDYYRIHLTAGVSYVILLGNDFAPGSLSLPNSALVLYSPGEHVEDFDIDQNSPNTTLWYTPTLSGYYYLSAQSLTEATGGYSLAVHLGTAPDSFHPRLETNVDIISDFPNNGFSVFPGQRAVATINGPSDIDGFSASMMAGETYIASVTGIGPTPLELPAVGISALSSTLPEFRFLAAVPFFSQVTLQSTEAKNISIYAQEQPPFAGQVQEGGNYLLSFIKADTIETTADVAGNNIATAVDFNLNGGVVGRINHAGDQDYYRLNLFPDATYVLSLSMAPGVGGLQNPSYFVFSEYGDFITGGSTSGNGKQVRLSGFGEDSVIVRVNSGLPDGTGEYVLSAVQVYDAVYDGIATTETLALEKRKYGALETGDDEDWYKVTLDSDLNYNIQVSGNQDISLFSPAFAVYSADGSRIVDYSYSDYGTNFTDVSAVFNPLASGEYYIAVKKEYNSETYFTGGDFALSISETTAPPDMGDRPEPELSISAPSSLPYEAGINTGITVNYKNLQASEETPAILLANGFLSSFQDAVGSSSQSMGFFVFNQNGSESLSVRNSVDFFRGERIFYDVGLADPDEIIDWQAQKSTLRPAFLSDATWDKIFDNFIDGIGTTVRDFSRALAPDAHRLGDMGIAKRSVAAALSYELEQSGDFGTIAEHGRIDSLGKGWSSLADVRLAFDPKGAMFIMGLVNADFMSALDARQTAQYAVSMPLGKIIGQDGQLDEGTFVRPQFSWGQRIDDGIVLSSIRNGYEAMTLDGDKFIFDSTGKLTSFISAAGEQINVVYNAQDKIARYQNATGDFLDFTYDSAGKVTQVTDGNGRNVSYDYAAGDELIEVTDDAGKSVFSYDANGNLITSQRIAGPELTFSYDSEGRLASQTLGSLVTENYTYDGAGAVSIINGAGQENIIQLTPNGQIAGITNNLDQSIYIDTQTNTSMATRTLTMEGADGTQSSYTYDLLGRLLSVKDGNGDTVRFGYESATSDLIRFTDAEGNVRQYDYDDASRLISAKWGDGTTRDYQYDPLGNLAEVTNRRGDSVQYEHDARGRVTEVSDSSSGPASYNYDARGNVTLITTAAGETRLSYDGADRVTLIEYPNGRSLAYTYDAAGRRLSMVDQDGEGTFYAYDAAGRFASVSDNNGVLTSYTYDAAGRLSLETNRNGTETEYEYDGAGRTQGIFNRDSDGNINSFHEYEYDAAGKVIASTTQDGEWIYEYDDAAQLTRSIFVSDTPDVASVNIQYEYDAAGNRIRTIENGVTTNYATNALNQYDTSGNKSFDYDADGNMVSQTAPGNNHSYVYDVNSRLIQVTGPGGEIASYEYDAFGNRSAVIQNGVRTEFLVDPFGLGNVVSEYQGGVRTASYAHGLGLVSRADAGGSLAFFDADATGSITGLTNASGDLVNRYVYTPFGDELFESETVLNSFEFNGAFGVSEDSENLLYMRARSYDVELGRFLSEDPLFFNGDIGNLYRFSFNDPVQLADPAGDIGFIAFLNLAGIADNIGTLIPPTIAFITTDSPEFRKALLLEMMPNLISLGLGSAYLAKIKSITESGGDFLSAGLFLFPKIDELFGGDIIGTAHASTNVSASRLSIGMNRGDPHYTTFDGLGYDFQAAGEFVLVRSGNGLFEVQVRQEPWQDRDDVSVNTALAALVEGHRVQIHATQGVLVDGFSVVLADGEFISIGEGGLLLRNGDSYILSTANGSGVRVDVNDSWIDVLPFVDAAVLGGVKGLFGNNDGIASNDLVMADGTPVPQPVPSSVLYGEFADSWRVTDETSLFTYGAGESTETFTDRDFPGVIVTLDDLEPVARAAAEQIVRDAGLQEGTYEFNSAVLDIVLTGETAFIPDADFREFVPPVQEEVELQLQPVTGDDAAATGEDTSITVDVLANDSDPEGDPLTLVGGLDANGGAVSVVDNKLHITPAANYFGNTVVTYNVSDGQGNISVGKLILTVNPVNDAPIARDDQVTGNEDIQVTGNVLADNGHGVDTDVDLDSLSVVAQTITTAKGGSVQIFANGDFTYMPAAEFSGSDDFEYTVQDGDGGNDTGKVTLTINAVNDAPVLTNNGGSVNEDGSLILTPGMLSLADVDTAPNNRTYTLHNLSAHGTLYINSIALTLGAAFTQQDIINGLVIYKPALNFNGSDGFNFIASDGMAALALQTFEIDVTPVNDAPVAGNDSFTFTQGQTMAGKLLLNDVDIDGDILRTQQSTFLTTQGNSVTILENGDFIYVPASNFSGTDSFSYNVLDGHGGTGAGTVTLTINSSQNIITGGNGFDLLYGTGRDDIIRGLGGLDIIFGRGGNDNIQGGEGVDTLFGDEGNDTISGDNGADLLYGDDGNDVLRGGNGNDLLFGGRGDNELYGDAGNDLLYGGTGKDLLNGGAGNDSLYGDGGNDTLRGDAGKDVLYGDAGNDILMGGAENDTLYGGAGSDVFKFHVNGGIDTIKDFKISQGDKLDIHDILTGYDPVSSAITNFIQITNGGKNSIVKIDANGLAGGTVWTQIATIENATGLTDESALKNNGTIIV